MLKCDSDWIPVSAGITNTCWINGPDHFAPPMKQNGAHSRREEAQMARRKQDAPTVGAHHVSTVLRALYEAIDMWDHQPGKN
jgi:hypothetical protein